jgi:thiol-disulfide isomerase/thioredoxin
MSGVLLSLFVQTAWAITGADSYSEAYQQMTSTGGPMLVVVGADWCGPCVQLKRSTIPTLTRNGQLENVPVAFVNLDREPQLARQLMRGGTIPQVVVFRNTPRGWHRRQLTGGASSNSVLAIVNEARGLEGVKPIETRTTAGDSGSGAE